MSTSESHHFLLIGDSEDEYGSEVLRQVLEPLGPLHVTERREMDACLQERFYDVVVVDAAAVPKVAPVVSQIREQSPDSKVVVMTMSRHWKVARDALRAGASAYLRKSQPKEEMLASFRELVE